MKQKMPLQKIVRMMSLILALAILPFLLKTIEKKMVPQRHPSSDETAPPVMNDHAQGYDLSEATPEEFKKAFKYQVLKNVSVENTAMGPAMQLGLFLIKNESGAKVFVCDQYPTVDVIFEAEGVAFSGEIPRMIVRVPCVVSADQKHIDIAPIPFARILQSAVSEHEFTTSFYNSPEQGKIYFRNVMEFWPTDWNFVGVTFYSADGQKTLQINGYEVISVLGEPLTLSAQ